VKKLILFSKVNVQYAQTENNISGTSEGHANGGFILVKVEHQMTLRTYPSVWISTVMLFNKSADKMKSERSVYSHFFDVKHLVSNNTIQEAREHFRRISRRKNTRFKRYHLFIT